MSCKPCADGVVVIAISLFPEVPGSIPERGKKRRFLWILLLVHLLSFLRRSDPFRGITSPWRAILGRAKATQSQFLSQTNCTLTYIKAAKLAFFTWHNVSIKNFRDIWRGWYQKWSLLATIRNVYLILYYYPRARCTTPTSMREVSVLFALYIQRWTLAHET